MSSNYFKVTAWHASLIEFLYALGMMFGAALMTKFGTIKDKLVAAQIGLFVMGVTALLAGLLSAHMAGFWDLCGAVPDNGRQRKHFYIPLYRVFTRNRSDPSARPRILIPWQLLEHVGDADRLGRRRAGRGDFRSKFLVFDGRRGNNSYNRRGHSDNLKQNNLKKQYGS